MIYQVAFDPSIAHIGYCLFVDGKPMKAGTFNRPKYKRTYADKLDWVFNSVDDYLESLIQPYKGLPKAIAIEDFQCHTKNPTKSLLKLAAAQGVLFASANGYSHRVVFINKGNKGKDEAQMLAKAYGITGSEHALDALHIGVLAGFVK